jgi:hypothetical protein
VGVVAEALQDTYIGRLALGFIKILLATALAAILANININASGTVAGQNVDLTVVVEVIKVFAPLLLVISGLRDLGVRI